MNAQAQAPQAPTAADYRGQMLARAANAFMLVQISVSTWRGVALNKNAARKAATDAGAKAEAGRLYVDMLGSHQRELKTVTARYTEMRSYLYANSLPYSTAAEGQQARGDRLVAVARVPEVLTELQKLAAAANAARDAFLADYDRLVSYARSNDLGQWADMRYPSRDDVAAQFRAVVQPPRPLSIPDAEHMAALPASMAAEIAAQHAQQGARMLEGAKAAAIAAAQEHVAKVARQLREGQRLHQSLIDNAKLHADLLTDIAAGTDHDPRLLELAEIIRRDVANVEKTEQWKDAPGRRSAAATAAATAAKGLARLAEAPAPSAAPVAPVPQDHSAATPGDVVLGGVLADLW